MQSKHDWTLFHTSVAALLVSVALGPHPSSSVAALALLAAYRLCDRYLHNSFFDGHEKAIKQLSADFAKIKSKSDQEQLKTAFGARNGQG